MKLHKKFVSVLLAFMLLLSTLPVKAENEISVVLSGNKLSFDVPPQIINDRTMVPLRAIFEALGASVDWDESTSTVTSSKDGTTVILTVGSNVMYVNGREIAIDTPACIKDGRTLVPVRAISESYGLSVEWSGNDRTVYISADLSTSVDYSKYIGKYSHLGGSLGFAYLLNIRDINDTTVTFDFGYEKPGFYYTAEPAVFTDATHATAPGKMIFNNAPYYNEEDLIYTLEFTEDGINVMVGSDSGAINFSLLSDKIA